MSYAPPLCIYPQPGPSYVLSSPRCSTQRRLTVIIVPTAQQKQKSSQLAVTSAALFCVVESVAGRLLMVLMVHMRAQPYHPGRQPPVSASCCSTPNQPESLSRAYQCGSGMPALGICCRNSQPCLDAELNHGGLLLPGGCKAVALCPRHTKVTAHL